MTTMRAVIIDETGSAEVLRAADVPMPVRTSAEFLVKVVAAGVNPIDAKTRAGSGAAGAIQRWPVILGNDFSGIVVDPPYHGHPIKPGDEVYGMTMVPRFDGAYAEFLTVPALCVARKPKCPACVIRAECEFKGKTAPETKRGGSAPSSRPR